jgi:metal-responsive CopG/Arc/MetJ family transcriptional regulator
MVKERVSLTIRKELLTWLDSKVQDLTYANRSHAVESLIAKEMKGENAHPKKT